MKFKDVRRGERILVASYPRGILKVAVKINNNSVIWSDSGEVNNVPLGSRVELVPKVAELVHQKGWPVPCTRKNFWSRLKEKLDTWRKRLTFVLGGR